MEVILDTYLFKKRKRAPHIIYQPAVMLEYWSSFYKGSQNYSIQKEVIQQIMKIKFWESSEIKN